MRFHNTGIGATAGMAFLFACGGQSPDETAADAGSPTDTGAGDIVPETPAREAMVDAAPDTAAALDGPPTYTSECTPLSQQTGKAINTDHGRLDGTLAYVVPQDGPHACNGDNSHVHLQIRTAGAIYDVAVDIGTTNGDVLLDEADMSLPDGAWTEGWAGSDTLSYVALGLKGTQFAPQDPATLAQKIADELSGVNHVSVFCTGYTQENGCHDVHYEGGGGNDGALIIHPLGPTPHILFFHFSNQSF